VCQAGYLQRLYERAYVLCVKLVIYKDYMSVLTFLCVKLIIYKDYMSVLIFLCVKLVIYKDYMSVLMFCVSSWLFTKIIPSCRINR